MKTSAFKVLAVCALITLGTTGCHVRKKGEDVAFRNCMMEGDNTYSQHSSGTGAVLHAKAAGLCVKGQQICKKSLGSSSCERFRRRYGALR